MVVKIFKKLSHILMAKQKFIFDKRGGFEN